MVVLYFFLFLFKFLKDITPPIPNSFFMYLGDFIFLEEIFKLALFLIESISDTLEALVALFSAEK